MGERKNVHLGGITNMKTAKLTKVALSLALATQLLSADAFAVGTKKFEETLVTGKKELLKDPYYQIKSKQIRELTDEEALEFAHETPGLTNKAVTPPITPTNPNIPQRPGSSDGSNRSGSTLVAAGGGGATPAPTGTLDGVIMIIDKLIAIGQKVIPTIEKGRPAVTNNSMAAISVLPRLDTKDPVVHDMGDWSLPMSKHYKITYSNGFGAEVVSFVYSITYQYGGTYGGQGKYLTGIRASARNITVSWGFDLDASSQLIQISNVGTAQNIIAGATIEMSYTVKNFARQITTNESFFVAGDGRLYKMD